MKEDRKSVPIRVGKVEKDLPIRNPDRPRDETAEAVLEHVLRTEDHLLLLLKVRPLEEAIKVPNPIVVSSQSQPPAILLPPWTLSKRRGEGGLGRERSGTRPTEERS